MSDSRQRKRDGVLVVEGKQFVAETLHRCPELIRTLVRNEASRFDYDGADQIPVWTVSNGLYRAVSSIGPSDGIMAICKRPQLDLPPETVTRLVVLDQIQTPENLGAIVRSAAAFGWDGIAVTPGTCDPFHPDAIRAMAGNWFQVPFYTLTADWVSQWPGTWVMLDVKAKRELAEIPLGESLAVVFGSEGNGIQSDWFSGAGTVKTTRIPMVSDVESLNAAVSAGIVLYYFSNKELH